MRDNSNYRCYVPRGNAVCDVPTSRDAGASKDEFPHRAWELSLYPSN